MSALALVLKMKPWKNGNGRKPTSAGRTADEWEKALFPLVKRAVNEVLDEREEREQRIREQLERER